jgi:hypothetical protein
MLGRIHGVTTTASDLGAVEDAYSRYLDYVTVETGVVSLDTAIGWGAPLAAGRDMLVMRPASGDPTFLRFVRQDLPAGYKALTTFGWNATEILVADTDALEDRLRGSPFRITFPPKELTGLPDIRAMQGLGPAEEMLYLTHVKRPVAGYDLPVAQSFVDRCFITVVAGPDMAALRAFYRDIFGNKSNTPHDTPVAVIADANDAPPDTLYPHATVALGDGSLVELDEYPPPGRPRPVEEGQLPPGMAIVTFACPDFARHESRLIAPPRPATLPPFPGHQSGTLRGAADELIEIIAV